MLGERNVKYVSGSTSIVQKARLNTTIVQEARLNTTDVNQNMKTCSQLIGFQAPTETDVPADMEN